MKKFDSIESAINDIKLGKMVIVVDNEDRENEGDFVMAADCVDAKAINFMATYGRGLICTPLSVKRAKELELNLMVASNDAVHETAFTVSVDSVDAGTGISCADRTRTIKAMLNPKTKPETLLRPGHIFPLIAKDGGVLVRDGHTEASVDLARLAGFSEMGVICEIMNEDGEMARRDDLVHVAKKHDLKLITIKDLIAYRKKMEIGTISIKETTTIDFPNKYGDFKLHIFDVDGKDEHHIALVKGDIATHKDPLLVRVHSECFTGDIFGSMRCDCGEQLDSSMKMIQDAGAGILLYMRQEGRGIGLVNKIKAYQIQDQGFDTVEANIKLGFDQDLRNYDLAAEILKNLGAKKIELITNNPKKIEGLEASDLEIVNRCSIEIKPNEMNLNYLTTKRDRMGHMILNDLQ